MVQMDLPFPDHGDRLRAYFEGRTKKNILLTLTDNSTSMLSVRKKGSTISIRLHRMFLTASEPVLDEISGFISNQRGKTPHISNFISLNSHTIRERPPRAIPLCTQGRNYDLLEIYNDLNSSYFDDRICASITWGKQVPGRSASKRTLGSYSYHNNTIRISRMLDSARVPRYYLEYVIYHEMLHADIGPRHSGGRRAIHTSDFRARERQFLHYRKAVEWERKG